MSLASALAWVGERAGKSPGLPADPPARSALLCDRLALAVLLIATVLVLATFTRYGVTWDEDVHNWYGNFVLDYYLSGFTDQRALHFQDLTNYGAVFDMTAAALNRFSPLGVYETRHLLNGIVGLFGLFGCWKLGRHLGGARAGLLALVFLLLTPNWYGQMFNNPKDIPFAVGGVWSLYYMIRLLPSLPRPPLRLVVKLGIAIGFALAVRIGGLLFVCYLGVLLGLSGLWQAAEQRRPAVVLSVVLSAAWSSLWRVALPALVVAYPIMLLFWPWAQHGSLLRPLIALANFSHQTFPYTTLFDGRFVPAWNLPWTYLPTYIVVVLPELVLVLLLAAPIAAAVALSRGRLWQRREIVLAWFLLAFAIVFPVGYAIAIKAVLFDGMRHFIFILPPIAVVSALLADAGLKRLARLPIRYPAYAALGLYGAAHVTVMTMLHPDEYVYYNAFVGGIDGAQRRFKLDYWANSYIEAVHGLERKLRAQYGPDFEEHEFTVAVCGPATPARYYFPGNFRLTYQREQADFYIAFTKDNCDRSFNGKPIYEVTRMGVLLSLVLDRREILAERRVVKHPLAGAVRKQAPVSAFP